MNAGRELDALAHEKVMGYRRMLSSEDIKKELNLPSTLPPAERISMLCELHQAWVTVDGLVCYGEIPQYSIDIAAAWGIVEKLKITVSPPGAPLADGEYTNPSEQWKAEVWLPPTLNFRHSESSYADTAPLAICLAALKACGIVA